MIPYLIAGIIILLSAAIAIYQADYKILGWIFATACSLGLAALKEWKLNQIIQTLKALHEISSSLSSDSDSPRTSSTPSR